MNVKRPKIAKPEGNKRGAFIGAACKRGAHNECWKRDCTCPCGHMSK